MKRWIVLAALCLAAAAPSVLGIEGGRGFLSEVPFKCAAPQSHVEVYHTYAEATWT